ncbi:hydrolase, alpha/beta fold family-like protein [Novymonas esmeraldas]|uniref:Hydrolase, alpha/beta fold family-like protein n=1 Tax=Novymonas esmeraldas TaxID=1808958 RepID=A0AAW0EUD6_9TRYP
MCSGRIGHLASPPSSSLARLLCCCCRRRRVSAAPSPPSLHSEWRSGARNVLMSAPNATTLAAASELPNGFRGQGVPLPSDKFIKIGRCASTGEEITICYNTAGDPTHPCLLLVMGLGGTGWYWKDEFVQSLVDVGLYVVRYDHRDTGLSTHLDGYPTPFIARMILPTWASIGEGVPPYTLYDMASDAWGLLTALGIERAHVLGSSMGGMIAQCMALQKPERVKSLTIVFSHSGGPNVKPQTWRMSLAMLEKPASPSLEDRVDFKVHLSSLFTGDYPLDEPVARATAHKILSRCPEDKAGLLRHIWAVQRAESREAGLRQLRGIPTLILHGMEDTMVPFENGLQLARLIDGSKLVSFARMGHAIPKELYTEIVAEVALQLQRGEATPPPPCASPAS